MPNFYDSQLSFRAMTLALSAHWVQKRKYTGNPYFDHLAEVVGILSSVIDGTTTGAQALLATAWLHDLREDCPGYSEEDISKILDPHGQEPSEIERVLRGLRFLTAPPKAPGVTRAQRTLKYRKQMANAPHWVQTIKCADIISNSGSIVTHDPRFAKTYVKESRDMLDELSKADKRLWCIADNNLNNAQAELDRLAKKES